MENTQTSASSLCPGQSGMANVVERHIEALLKRERAEEGKKTWQNSLADAITGFTSSMTFVLIHLTLFSLWIIWNLRWLGLKPFDPSFVILAMFAPVEAIFLSAFVLIRQNRTAALNDKRAKLNLQVSLLGEYEITRLIILTTEIARKMNIEVDDHSEIPELSKDVHPERVLDTIEKHEEDLLQQQCQAANS